MDDDTTYDTGSYDTTGGYGESGAYDTSSYDTTAGYAEPSIDSNDGAVDAYAGSGEYTTDTGTDVTVEDHSGDGYADVYGSQYGDSNTYSNYESASQTSNDYYNQATQAYINGDEETSQNLTYASQQAGEYANDQYSAWNGTGDYAPQQVDTNGYDPNAAYQEATGCG